MKRFCQTLHLKEDLELIRQYTEIHRQIWPEIKAGIREVGILDMEIYIHGNTLFMIVETTDAFDWVKDNQRSQASRMGSLCLPFSAGKCFCYFSRKMAIDGTNF